MTAQTSMCMVLLSVSRFTLFKVAVKYAVKFACCVTAINKFIRNDALTFLHMKSAVEGSSGTLRIEDDCAFDDYVFSWPEHRCMLFNHLYPDIGSLLEEEFQSVLSLFSREVPAELSSDHQLNDVSIND